MKEIAIPFSIFDFFAVLLPGGIGLLGLYMFVFPWSYRKYKGMWSRGITMSFAAWVKSKESNPSND